ncbi:mitochondrial 37S ribosomal protein RSM19 [Schizosaccharomyces japonicus yFS275]|uniref:Small ribosomal subunit protein uS19m n=1 Tax=Schizosaccharomyces japonicus (strain yFS275 / FY16936) TaxID=402676 RepID=B6K842_SCHJY|nr:mitochondrial 37S ribosomal protein RSM19 [Schizosaccharomyces japonicus yFS275]EEB09696.1 ribosomal protein subunit S19 [Schizosaccharomyces japonicus yFS275]
MRFTRILLSRSVWKGPNVVDFGVDIREHILKKIPIKTKARSATILPQMVGADFMVHNGKAYPKVHITEDMVGHKLGEFSLTRKPFSYRKTKNR